MPNISRPIQIQQTGLLPQAHPAGAGLSPAITPQPAAGLSDQSQIQSRQGSSATYVTLTSPKEAGKEKDAKHALLSAIHASMHQICLVNPSFSDPDLVQALESAAERGVEVKILVPAGSDNPSHGLLNAQNGERMMPAGAKVISVDAGKNGEVFSHAKLITIDGISHAAELSDGSRYDFTFDLGAVR